MPVSILSSRPVRLILGAFAVAAFCTPLGRAEDPVENYATDVLPILMKRCGHCHGPETQEARLRFDELSTNLANDRNAAQRWQEARNAINAGEMPPEDEPQLTAAERELVTDWINRAIERAIRKQRSSGGRVVLRRLNNDEYQNTMFDLLGLDMDYTRDLPPDGASPDGYTNNGQSLRMSAIQLEYYLETARRALQRVIVAGPPPRVYRHHFTSSNVGGWRGPTEKSNRLERAQKFLAKMVNDYPEDGEFRIRVKLRSELKPNKGFPLLECSVGYRPDTEVHFRVAGVKEIVGEGLQQVEFRGRLENFPLPVRGQGKYPGLVVRLRNVYDDGTPVPAKLETRNRNGKDVKAFASEPDLPALLIESVDFEGPVYSQWPPAIHRRVLFDSPLQVENEVEYVREVLQRFMSRAYRRPATRAETEEMFAFFASIRPHFTSSEDAIRETLAMVLIQPDFLYLMEPGGQSKRNIGDWELASRLSYFLGSTMPDQRLLELAKAGLLHEPKVLEAEANRLLDSERGEILVDRFAGQWLRLGQMENISIDRATYANFDSRIKADMREETTRLFLSILRKDESALTLLDADFSMLNETLARHYGLPGVYGSRFRRVSFDPAGPRGGLTSHASILLANSSGRDSHPVRRAVWIRDRLLDDPPAPPPPDVPELDEADPRFANLSVREQLEIHRDRESCASCHRDLDPWGLALEDFDAIGRWRGDESQKIADSVEASPSIATNTLPDGTRLNGIRELRDHLRNHRSHDFARSLVRNLMTYALGRTLELSDEPDIEQILKDFKASDYQLRKLVLLIVQSSAFNTK